MLKSHPNRECFPLLCFSKSSVSFKMGQGYRNRYESVNVDRGYRQAEFQWPHLINLQHFRKRKHYGFANSFSPSAALCLNAQPSSLQLCHSQNRALHGWLYMQCTVDLRNRFVWHINTLEQTICWKQKQWVSFLGGSAWEVYRCVYLRALRTQRVQIIGF